MEKGLVAFRKDFFLWYDIDEHKAAIEELQTIFI